MEKPTTSRRKPILAGATTDGSGQALDYYSAEGSPKTAKIIDVFHCHCRECQREFARLAELQNLREWEASEHFPPLEMLWRRLTWALKGPAVVEEVPLADLIIAFIEGWGDYLNLIDDAVKRAVRRIEATIDWPRGDIPPDSRLESTPIAAALDALERQNRRLFSVVKLREESRSYLARKIVLFHNTGRLAPDFTDAEER